MLGGFPQAQTSLLGILFGGKETQTSSQCIPNPKGALFDARSQAAI